MFRDSNDWKNDDVLYIDEYYKKDWNEWTKLDRSIDEDILLEGGERKTRSNEHQREKDESYEKE